MGEGGFKWTLRKILAALMSLLIITSYVTCIAIAKANDTWIGGLTFPYFSDIGRDPPAYYVFASLNTIAAVAMFAFMPLQYMYMEMWFSEMVDPSYKCRSITAVVFGLIAAIGAALLSIFDTSTYPDLHAYAAYVFFVAILIHVICSTTLYHTLSGEFVEHNKLKLARYIVLAIMAISFIIYIPVGLALVTFVELSYTNCLLYIQDVEFCQDHLLDDSNSTTDLWDYTDEVELNTMRSATQFTTIISIMVFLFMYTFDPTTIPVTPSTEKSRESLNNA